MQKYKFYLERESVMTLKKVKAYILIVFLASLPLNKSIKVYANEQDNYNEIKPRIVGDYYTWRAVGSHKVGTVSKGGWVHFYTGSPATRNGEKDIISGNITVNKELTGNLKITYGKLEGILGFSATKKETFSVSKVSAPLKKGEYVKAYYKKLYTKHEVTQRQYVTTNGMTYATQNYAYVYPLNPLMPQIKLEYYK